MKTKIQKWGNSLGVRLPKNITEQKALRAGLGVSIVIKNDQIVIEPREEELSLETLLNTVSADNLHKETDWSKTQGNEVW
ncbi:AbrB/MazE/SpoVT family DNA-binding domain-containing protein [Candidatus Kaiserbacteria bacterium CG10_big_fil_rev_8_21_14_0_10_44_10]|uniref:AbrB/MazE/SpoVT family DNA-binding domain-containing protein n=1 Tax=Candidatus Kaiserbacteria bacterium CG10_big_fil_rev_8_21_14_0_10_44_10 TaxID=1974606 RepID=A0A2H0UH18_9BACT|nr:MAG: AbrB/MazE/SpoVT family DNA-binding domain-containing protein [Candidatus Kaiserbacteria bacterium CG10_big_fil_rev_8_21_14_0_10_44_10]